MKAIKIYPGKVVHISDDDEIWFDPEEWKYCNAEKKFVEESSCKEMWVNT